MVGLQKCNQNSILLLLCSLICRNNALEEYNGQRVAQYRSGIENSGYGGIYDYNEYDVANGTDYMAYAEAKLVGMF